MQRSTEPHVSYQQSISMLFNPIVQVAHCLAALTDHVSHDTVHMHSTGESASEVIEHANRRQNGTGWTRSDDRSPFRELHHRHSPILWSARPVEK